MKKQFTLIFMMFVMVGLISSCKKDDEKSVTEKITGPSCWSLAKVEEKDDSGNYQDVTDEDYDACELDDCAKFNSNGTYILNDTGDKCPGSTDPVEEGTWSLSNSDKTFTIIAEGFPLLTTIESITDNQMVLTASLFDTDLRITYKN